MLGGQPYWRARARCDAGRSVLPLTIVPFTRLPLAGGPELRDQPGYGGEPAVGPAMTGPGPAPAAGLPAPPAGAPPRPIFGVLFARARAQKANSEVMAKIA